MAGWIPAEIPKYLGNFASAFSVYSETFFDVSENVPGYASIIMESRILSKIGKASNPVR